MVRAGLTTDSVVAAAADLADEVGLDRMTLATLADRLGVRLPSLYKHIAGLPGLRQQLAVRAKVELAALLAKATAGQARSDALHALVAAYRGWAVEHPGRYAASLTAPAIDDTADQAASAAAVAAVYDALRGYELDDGTMIDAVRSLRAIIHGYLSLERSGAFRIDREVGTSLDWALAGLDAAMTAASSTTKTVEPVA